MKTALSLLNDLRVANPCSADWAQMQGTDQVRHCNRCKLNVYNLSQMTEAAATALIVEKEGQLCVRFYRRADGTLLTRDCPVGFPVRAWRRVCAVALAGVSLLAWLICEHEAKSTDSATQTRGHDTSTCERTMGKPAPPDFESKRKETNPPPAQP